MFVDALLATLGITTGLGITVLVIAAPLIYLSCKYVKKAKEAYELLKQEALSEEKH